MNPETKTCQNCQRGFRRGKVMVFGVFDGLHPGHRAFLKQARRYGKELIVVVARDNTVRKLKHKKPRQSEWVRLRAIQKVRGVNRAVLGDQKQSKYGVIKKYKPDIICLGYDQNLLKKDIEERIGRTLLPKLKLVQMAPYRPEELHSSFLRRRVK